MAFTSKVVKNTQQLKELKRMLDAGKNARVRVGILNGSRNERFDIFQTSQDKLNNATLGLIHEKGSVKRKIPPRSFLQVPLFFHLQKKIDLIGKAAWRALILKKGLLQALKELGVIGENTVQEAFNTGGFGRWPQWSKAYARRRELSARRKLGKMNFIGPIKAGSLLIRSAQLRKAVTSQVVPGATP